MGADARIRAPHRIASSLTCPGEFMMSSETGRAEQEHWTSTSDRCRHRRHFSNSAPGTDTQCRQGRLLHGSNDPGIRGWDHARSMVFGDQAADELEAIPPAPAESGLQVRVPGRRRRGCRRGRSSTARGWRWVRAETARPGRPSSPRSVGFRRLEDRDWPRLSRLFAGVVRPGPAVRQPGRSATAGGGAGLPEIHARRPRRPDHPPGLPCGLRRRRTAIPSARSW